MAELAGTWPDDRLVGIWNSLPGVGRVEKFKDGKKAVGRIWKHIQGLGQPAFRGLREPSFRRPISALRSPTDFSDEAKNKTHISPPFLACLNEGSLGSAISEVARRRTIGGEIHMTTWKTRILTTAAGVAGVAVLGALVAPKAITAVTNTPPTPVVVTNTQTQPIATQDTDQPARKPYIATINNAAIANAQENGIIGPKLPEGYRLVVEETSARCESDLGTDAVAIQGYVNDQGLQNKGWFYLNRINTVKVGNRIENFYTSLMRTYIEPGTYLTWGLFADSHPKQFMSCDLSVSGYLVSVSNPLP